MNNIIEFKNLLKQKNREEINKWKDKHYYIDESGFDGREIYCKDVDVLYELFCIADMEQYILTYIKPIDEEDYPISYKWIPKKKKDFFVEILIKNNNSE
tara:strand:+ start:122 stop:418 length:297 start_codon:yes stop_codon:yes gene_type:complete